MNFFLPLALILLAQPETPAQPPPAPEATSTQTPKKKTKTSSKRSKPTAQQPPAEPSSQPPDKQPAAAAAAPTASAAPTPPPAKKTPTTPPEKSTKNLAVEQAKPQKHVPLLGFRLDVGIPDGVGLDFLGHPLPFLQLHLGLMTNILGIGLRGGLSYIPWHGVFRPLVVVEAGHHFNNFSWFLPDDNTGIRNFISGVQYTFLNTALGFDVGSANVAFVFRLGGSFIFFRGNEFAPQDSSENQTLSIKKIKANVFFPTVKFGISVCFL